MAIASISNVPAFEPAPTYYRIMTIACADTISNDYGADNVRPCSWMIMCYRCAISIAGAFVDIMMADLIPLIVVYFAVVDPIGTVPIYLSVTENFTPKQKQHIAIRSSLIAFAVLMFFGFFGDLILDHLKISAASFNIAGGALLFLIAVEMVNGRRQARKQRSAESSDVISEDVIRISASPIAIPLLAGPGAITSIMLYGNFDSLEGSLQNTTAILTVMVISGVLLFFSGWASKYINLTISTVMSRVVGILLAAIAIQTILNGLSHFGLINI